MKKRAIMGNIGLVAALLGLPAAGCSSDDVGAGVTSVASGIFNGTPTAAEGSGHATGPANCSYELLTNTWALGARHCIGAGDIGASLTIGAQVRTIDDVRLHPKWDVSLARVSAPFTIGGSTTGYRREIFGGPSDTMLGRLVTCYGYGFNGPGSGLGTLRMATYEVVSAHPNPDVDPQEVSSLDYGVNALGQYACGGDSGSSCFLGGHIAGLQNAGNDQCNAPQNGSGVAAASFREWVYASIGHEFPVVGNTPADILLTGPAGWNSLPVATSQGDGNFAVTNGLVYDFGTWSAQAGVKRLLGDYNGDGRVDLALTGPTGWLSVPVALSHNNGGFRVYNRHPGDFPSWSAGSSKRHLVADVNTDLREDSIVIGNSSVTTFRMALSNGDATFTPVERSAAAGSHLSAQSFNQLADPMQVVALSGDFDDNGSGDVALVGGSTWSSIPVALTTGFGSSLAVTTRNWTTPGVATAARDASTKKLVGDFDSDGRADVLVLGPASSTVFRLALSTGNGAFDDTSCPAAAGDLSAQQFNTLALQPGVAAVVGDYNGDGRADVALTGGAGWTSIPVAFFVGCDVFTTNKTVGDAVMAWGTWASTSGVTKLSGRFSSDTRSDIALTGAAGWQTIPVARSHGDGFFTVTNGQVGDFGTWAATAGVQRFAGDVR